MAHCALALVADSNSMDARSTHSAILRISSFILVAPNYDWTVPTFVAPHQLTTGTVSVYALILSASMPKWGILRFGLLPVDIDQVSSHVQSSNCHPIRHCPKKA